MVLANPSDVKFIILQKGEGLFPISIFAEVIHDENQVKFVSLARDGARQMLWNGN